MKRVLEQPMASPDDPGVATTDELDLIDYRQAALLLNITPSTLYGWVHRRSVPHIRISRRLVRFSRRELLAWLDACSVSAKTGSQLDVSMP